MATYLLRKHLRTVESAGTPNAVAERITNAEARGRAMVDFREKYPVLSASNFDDADAYRIERIAYWTDKLIQR